MRIENGLSFARAAALIAALFLLPAIGGIERVFAPDAEPWPRWEAHDPASTARIDHSDWSEILARRVIDRPGPNLVAYAAFDDADRAALDRYLADLQGVAISEYDRDEQLAYWINLYNALTLRTVLENYPVDSIRDIDGGLFGRGPWDREVATVEGVALSLNDIEHRIVRPVWNDPRIHYAVNCAAIGCPDLRPSAWTAVGLDSDLDAAARAFVNDPRGASIEDRVLVVSSIYDWFHEDFGGTDAAVISHLRAHADGVLAQRLRGFDRLGEARYDWSLNAAR